MGWGMLQGWGQNMTILSALDQCPAPLVSILPQTIHEALTTFELQTTA